MRDVNKIRQEILDNIQWDQKKPDRVGGQHCGMPIYPTILRSEDLNIEITICYHRTQYKNRELALVLFELALDDILK